MSYAPSGQVKIDLRDAYESQETKGKHRKTHKYSKFFLPKNRKSLECRVQEGKKKGEFRNLEKCIEMLVEAIRFEKLDCENELKGMNINL